MLRISSIAVSLFCARKPDMATVVIDGIAKADMTVRPVLHHQKSAAHPNTMLDGSRCLCGTDPG